MSTNQDRRAEARKRLREQMEAQARREKQLRIVAASVVAVLVLGLVGFVVWKKYDEKKAREHAENWAACEYAPSEGLPEKIDPKEFEAQGGADMVKQAEDYNKKIDIAAKKKRDGEAPTGEQARRGTSEISLTTDRGVIPLKLDHSKAPCNVASFVGLVKQKYFDDTPCHRLTVADEGGQGIAVLQCGDPTGTGISGPGYQIVDEKPTDLPASPDGQGVVYPRGTVAMAKSQTPDSAGSQFFLVYQDSPLPPEYSVMGTIDEAGLKVLDAIAKDGTKSTDPNDPDSETPKKPVAIKTATLDGQTDFPQD